MSTSSMEWRKRKKHFFAEASNLLDSVGLAHAHHKYPYELSGGMRQRASLTQAMIMKPSVLLMDEPFGALDPTTREEAQRLTLELWSKHKMTILFVTHDLEEAVFLGTRILVLSWSNKNIKTGTKIMHDFNIKDTLSLEKDKYSKEFADAMKNVRKYGFPNRV